MIPKELCLDANVFISAMVVVEAAHEKALELFEVIDRHSVPLYEPAVVVFEFSQSLHRKREEGIVSQRLQDEILDFFFELPLLLQWQSSLIKRALASARNLSFRRTYDCAYLAVAMARDIPLVTEDQELLKKGRKIHRQLYSLDDFLRLSR